MTLREVDLIDELLITQSGQETVAIVVCGGAKRVVGFSAESGVVVLDKATGTIPVQDLPSSQVPSQPQPYVCMHVFE